MSASARFNTTRLRAELHFVHQQLCELVATQHKQLLDDLLGEGEAPSVLVWRALFSDCLRVVYCAAIADGQIYDFELEPMRDLLAVAARHFTGTPSAPYGKRPPIDLVSTRAFLDHYAQDSGPFGYGAAVRWRGCSLCRRAHAVGAGEPLLRYARLMWWLIDDACRLGGVSLSNPRSHDKLSDIHELRQILTSAGLGPEVDVDHRAEAFLSRPRLFTPVEQAVSVYRSDPFDVERLHQGARTSFARLVTEAMGGVRATSSGRSLLLVGGAGAGKTHLLRSFWSHVHEYGRGFVVYAQMYANVEDYTRYLLHSLIESLRRPYAGLDGGPTGLHELATGLLRIGGQDFTVRVERLAELHGGPRGALDRQIEQLVDELLGHPALASFDPDLLRALLYALCLDPKTTSRVYQYLRCEELNDHDRSLLGNISPKTTREDARSMLCKLARLAFMTRGAVLVVMLDQVELARSEADPAMLAFRGAVDAVLAIASEVHSVVAVIACLSNLYDKAIKNVERPTLDRLEHDPPPASLSNNLSYDEIEAIVSHRLAWLFAEVGEAYRAAEPVYPIPPARLRDLVNRRPRDVLEWCHAFHERCVAAGKIVDAVAPPLPPVPPPPPRVTPLDLAKIDATWLVAKHAVRVASLRDDEVFMLVTVAARAFALEAGLSVTSAIRSDELLRLQITGRAHRLELAIGVTNRGPQFGAFGSQIRNLCKVAPPATAIAVRTERFPSGAMSTQAVNELEALGGRASYLDKTTLKALISYQRMEAEVIPEHLQAWIRSVRPLSSLPIIATMFELAPGASEGDRRTGERSSAQARAAAP